MAKYADCIHGRNSAFCPMGCAPIKIAEKSGPALRPSLAAAPRPTAATARVAGAPRAAAAAVRESDQDVLNALCDLVGSPRVPIPANSVVPKRVLQVASGRVGLGYKVTVETIERIVTKGGVGWEDSFVQFDPLQDAHPRISSSGARALRDALSVLLD